MTEADPRGDGLLSSLRRLAEATLAIVENRLALAAVELSVEKFRLVEVLFWGAAFFFLGLLAVLLFTLTLIILFWDSARLAMVVGLTLFYLFSALGAFFVLRNRLKDWPPPFADTLAEIRKDRECLQDPKS